MTRTRLDDAQWVSLMLVMRHIPLAWKRDEAALRRFVEAALWICRTGAPWRDLPEALGLWSSVYHRWRRWCLRGWWEAVFEALRPSLPADGLFLLDSTTCKAHRAASGAADSTAAAEALGRSRGGLCSKLHACARGAARARPRRKSAAMPRLTSSVRSCCPPPKLEPCPCTSPKLAAKSREVPM